MCVEHNYVILSGDFNARTNTQDDFIDADDFLIDHFEFDSTLENFYNVSATLSDFNMDETHCSKDSNINNEGKILLELCKSNNLFILNGRCGKDKGIGSCTFKNMSVIDYTIVSAQALKFILNFEIVEMDSLYTDFHCLLNTTLTFTSKLKLHKAYATKKAKRPKWQEHKKDDFIFHLSNAKINQVMTQIELTRQNITRITKESLNNICTSVGNIFSESANKSFQRTQSFAQQNHNPDNKPWFGRQCQNARWKYHLARRIQNANPSSTNKTNLKNASQNYKKDNEFPHKPI